jgi:hypothetical protein
MATRCCWPRQLDGQRIGPVADADGVEQPAGLVDGLAARHAGNDEGDRHVFRRRQGWQQVVLLEDETDVLAAELHQALAAHLPQVVAKDVDVASAWVEQAGDDGDQRRFAAARRADQERHLAGGHLQVHPAHGLHAGVSLPELLPKAAADDRSGGGGNNRCLHAEHVMLSTIGPGVRS